MNTHSRPSRGSTASAVRTAPPSLTLLLDHIACTGRPAVNGRPAETGSPACAGVPARPRGGIRARKSGSGPRGAVGSATLT
jgi:hypothetical protein